MDAGKKKVRTRGIQERRNSGLDCCRKEEIKDCRETGKEKFGTGWIHERRNSGL